MMSSTSLVLLFGILSSAIQLSLALPKGSSCSCNGQISDKGSGECLTTYKDQWFCYVDPGQCQDEKESSQEGWYWSIEACATRTNSKSKKEDRESDSIKRETEASVCSCNDNSSQRAGRSGLGNCQTTHDGQPFCFNGGEQCPEVTEIDHWSNQPCNQQERQGTGCSCNGQISEKGSGECLTTYNEKKFCYVDPGKCQDEKESLQEGWYWSSQACEQRTNSNTIKEDRESTDPKTETEASVCSCNENSSKRALAGSGKCQTTHDGQPFCYIGKGQCPEETDIDHWSNQPCNQLGRSGDILPEPERDPNSEDTVCSCNGQISDKGSGECITTHKHQPFCYVDPGKCQDEKESSQEGWYWSSQACAERTGTTEDDVDDHEEPGQNPEQEHHSTGSGTTDDDANRNVGERHEEPAQDPKQDTVCSCNGQISAKGSGECLTTHEEKPFCYVDAGKCIDEKESSQEGWYWSKEACEKGTNATITRHGNRGRPWCQGHNFPGGADCCGSGDSPKCIIGQGDCDSNNDCATGLACGLNNCKKDFHHAYNDVDDCCYKPAKVNGKWSSWTSFRSCSKSCGSGTHTRTRTCTNPSPAWGGVGCSGSSTHSQTCNSQACPTWIYTSTLKLGGNPWGNWGTRQTCKYPHFANAIGLRTEGRLSSGRDDTALNGIRLHCKNGVIISSHAGYWGGWGGWQVNHSGFKSAAMRWEDSQGSSDDTAANGIRVKCYDSTYKYPGDGFWGHWESWRHCPAGSVVYGIQTRVEGKQGLGDDTALNRVEFLCAKKP